LATFVAMRGYERDSELDPPLLQRIARHRYTPRQLLAIDAVAAVALFVFAFYAGPHKASRVSGSGWAALHNAADVVAAVAVLLRHRLPRVTLAVVLPIALVVLCLRGNGPSAFFLVLAVYSVVAISARAKGIRVVTAVIASSVICIVIGGGSLEASSVTGVAAIILLGWLAGENARANRAYARRQRELEAERAAEAEAIQAGEIQRAVAGERVKIARELHDIVAHALSVIAVRSGVARMVIDTQPDQAREALSIIETTTRRTLHEMRLLLGMLRDTDDPAVDHAPAPGLDDVARLVAEIQLAGVSVDLELIGPARPLPPAANLSAYRIIQEALTNVVQHAGPTSARVRITYRPDVVEIAVSDDGPAPGSTPVPALARPGTGHGLIGMRERTALFGGTLCVAPHERGFRVQASLRTDG
jgi:signal transduction histidine kinase